MERITRDDIATPLRSPLTKEQIQEAALEAVAQYVRTYGVGKLRKEQHASSMGN